MSNLQDQLENLRAELGASSIGISCHDDGFGYINASYAGFEDDPDIIGYGRSVTLDAAIQQLREKVKG